MCLRVRANRRSPISKMKIRQIFVHKAGQYKSAKECTHTVANLVIHDSQLIPTLDIPKCSSTPAAPPQSVLRMPHFFGSDASDQARGRRSWTMQPSNSAAVIAGGYIFCNRQSRKEHTLPHTTAVRADNMMMKMKSGFHPQCIWQVVLALLLSSREIVGAVRVISPSFRLIPLTFGSSQSFRCNQDIADRIAITVDDCLQQSTLVFDDVHFRGGTRMRNQCGWHKSSGFCAFGGRLGRDTARISLRGRLNHHERHCRSRVHQTHAGIKRVFATRAGAIRYCYRPQLRFSGIYRNPSTRGHASSSAASIHGTSNASSNATAYNSAYTSAYNSSHKGSSGCTHTSAHEGSSGSTHNRISNSFSYGGAGGSGTNGCAN